MREKVIRLFDSPMGLATSGIALSVAYAVITRIIFGLKGVLLSQTYLLVIPPVLGVMALAFADERMLKSYRNIIFLPWLTVFFFFTTMWLMGMEGILCLGVLAVPFFVLGTAGALIYRLMRIYRDNKNNRLWALGLGLLPFLVSPLEEYLSHPTETFIVQREIFIQTDAETVWQNIIRVKEISADEYPAGLINTLGIPIPQKATLDREEAGALRTGYFFGGMKLSETVSDWHPLHRMGLQVNIDSASLNPEGFETHVFTSGYFQFDEVAYELEDAGTRGMRLRLLCRYHLTSRMNAFANLWGQIILGDFESRLLRFLKSRIERENNIPA